MNYDQWKTRAPDDKPPTTEESPGEVFAVASNGNAYYCPNNHGQTTIQIRWTDPDDAATCIMFCLPCGKWWPKPKSEKQR